MANTVNSTIVSRILKLAVNNGTAANGSTKTISRNFTNINPNATATQLKAAADAIVGLIDDSVSGVYDVKKALLQTVEEED